MLLEIIGSLGAAGLLTYTLIDQNASLTDAGKIQRVANNCGLTISEKGRKQTIHLLRKVATLGEANTSTASRWAYLLTMFSEKSPILKMDSTTNAACWT